MSDQGLRIEEVSAGYSGLQILHGISLHVDAGELVSIVGANGAGKSTTLRLISGLLRASAGTVTYAGERIDGRRPHEIVRRGVVQVSEGRDLFGPMSVDENLRLGAWTVRSGVDELLDEVYALFPALAERRRQAAQTMSGGQQQMLAIGRALMSRPKLLMLDEPSTGLSPKLTWEVLEAVRSIRDRGVAVLLVEQNAAQALGISDRAYVLESGTIVLDGPGSALAEDARVRKAYLGL
ncbi:ABC transporter ATP-binding protein [Cryptosporangium arvum]|jgi:branched-chain amino acid transport system ATP-binding protein|uniref:ABC-type branched-chain amino acid transport system, ATPase component n=1 Tax=Cryptosporangium arvum DSM 44712 TaxID=927661 RepID=A0A010ZSE9_9ACTN|nr:ABC transporter ATP-binding protein [Cryptosporangium arvum]EXG81619.1 ABC-type branched-chain amino acid transport system, ATPase component [Cryptosporangium arvum DSM 44712]